MFHVSNLSRNDNGTISPPHGVGVGDVTSGLQRHQASGGGGVAAAGAESNTPPATSQNVPSSAGSEDYLVIGFGIEWQPEDFERMSELMNAAKEAADTPAGQLQHGPVAVIGDALWVQSTGAGGRKHGAPTYRWRLRGMNCTVLIMNRATPSGETPNLVVECSGEQIMSLGSGDHAYEFMLRVIQAIIGSESRIKFEKISRVDACVDLPGVTVAEFVEPFMQRQYVTRAKKATVHGEDQHVMPFEVNHFGRGVTGFSIGKGGQRMLRVYDKLRETAANEKKRELMLERRWLDGLPDAASRVEYQFRREALREWQIDTYADWKLKRAAVLRYMNEEWFRMVEAHHETHTTRADLLPLWTKVIEQFQRWAGRAVEAATKVVKPVTVTPWSMLAQSKGCMLRALAQMGMAPAILGEGRDIMREAWRCLLPLLADQFRQDELLAERLHLKHMEAG